MENKTMITLDQLKEASEKLNKDIIEYYKLVFDYYGLPRTSCDRDITIYEHAKDFKDRFGLFLIDKQLEE